MKIILKKINPGHHQLTIIRSDRSSEHIALNTDTYLLHDISHFFVESRLGLKNGFWGMLAKGYRMEQLSGKTNNLTEELRRIECIVGGAQSVYSNHMSTDQYWNYLYHAGISIDNKEFIEKVLPEIKSFMDHWKYLPLGESVELNFDI